MDVTEEMIPPLDADRRVIALPVAEVTLLEDRARVVRRGRIELEAGRARIAVLAVAPVAHDVSLQVVAEGATVADGRLRRAHRIARLHGPEAVKAVEARIEAGLVAQASAMGERARAEDAARRVAAMLGRSAAELPVDVAWGLHDAATWAKTFGDLFAQFEANHRAALAGFHAADDHARALRADITRRLAMDRPDVALTARIEIDLDVPVAGPIALEIGYVVPNALWRPTHRITLEGGALEVATRAAIWQFTGEDWADATLRFSTARGSLGTEPPLLDDDLLRAERRDEEVKIAIREVEIQRTGPEGAASGAVELPGVDDGGEVRVLSAPDPQTIASNGRAHFVPLQTVALPAEEVLIATPELVEAVFLEARATWEGPGPLLAGPCELFRGGGQVGTTTVPFTAPGQGLAVSFGAADELRVVRAVDQKTTPPDRHDPYTHVDTTVALYLSNLGPEDRQLTLIERVPVSEVPSVQIEAKGAPAPDADGMRRLELTLPARGQATVTQRWRMSTAPAVKTR